MECLYEYLSFMCVWECLQFILQLAFRVYIHLHKTNIYSLKEILKLWFFYIHLS